MCNCKDGSCKGCCGVSLIVKILLIIGGVNWGLVGVGMFMMKDWNIVHMLLNSMPKIEAIIYVIVGIAAIAKIIGCKCKKCTSCQVSQPAMGGEQKM